MLILLKAAKNKNIIKMKEEQDSRDFTVDLFFMKCVCGL